MVKAPHTWLSRKVLRIVQLHQHGWTVFEIAALTRAPVLLVQLAINSWRAHERRAKNSPQKSSR